jgi:hypothetical protein
MVRYFVNQVTKQANVTSIKQNEILFNEYSAQLITEVSFTLALQFHLSQEISRIQAS